MFYLLFGVSFLIFLMQQPRIASAIIVNMAIIMLCKIIVAFIIRVAKLIYETDVF